MLNAQEIARLREELQLCKRPYFFFHDDPDGLASFLLFYRFVKEGTGRPVKALPHITQEHCARVQEYGADKVFVLDIAMMDQEFIDDVNVPVIWIDHHPVQERERVQYYNPRKSIGLNVPTPVLCYQVTQTDLWLATIGAVGDWYWPPFAEEFSQQYPDILPGDTRSVPDAMFTTPLGTLIKVFSFNLKGATSEVNQAVKVLSRIESPYEILQQSTARGKFLWKKYQKINQEYERLRQKALETSPVDHVYVFTYTSDSLSLTKDLANELLYLMPGTVIILGREKSGEMRCSMRAPAGINLASILPKALQGIDGRGGGHEQAVGVAVKQEDWERFLTQLREELKKDETKG